MERIKAFGRVAMLTLAPVRAADSTLGILGMVTLVLILLGLISSGVVGWLAPTPTPDPTPKWPFIVAYPSLGFAVLIFIAAVRLQYRLDQREVTIAKLQSEIAATRSEGGIYISPAMSITGANAILFDVGVAQNITLPAISERHRDEREFDGETLYVAELVNRAGYIEDRIFRDCRITGPAVLAIDSDVMLKESSMGANAEWIWELPVDAAKVVGVVGLRRCVFERCTFLSNIAFAVRGELAQQLRSLPGGD